MRFDEGDVYGDLTGALDADGVSLAVDRVEGW